jgi:formate-dependent nitrite reductase membrane component NrfD
VIAILGIFILGIILGPIAICLALSAQGEIRDRPHKVKGECMANAGLIIGIIASVIGLLFVIIVIVS